MEDPHWPLSAGPGDRDGDDGALRPLLPQPPGPRCWAALGEPGRDSLHTWNCHLISGYLTYASVAGTPSKPYHLGGRGSLEAQGEGPRECGDPGSKDHLP